MNTIDDIRDRIPAYARDLGLNLGTVMTPRGSPGLAQGQILGIALASAIASRNVTLATELEAHARAELDPAHVGAVKAAAAVMGMNNIYYRFVHLVSDGDYGRMPARLRMNVLRNPGVPKTDFELLSLAVSAVNGCGLCISSHEKTLRAEGVSAEGIQSAIRIAAVIHGVAGVLEYEAVATADARAA
jgi:alkyl hydroperoxide reductase subunit D